MVRDGVSVRGEGCALLILLVPGGGELHRIRAELTKQRTAKANQIRGLVAEYGLVAPKELMPLRRALPCWLEDAENGLSARFRRLLNGLWGDLRTLDERIADVDREIAMIAQDEPAAKRLQQLRGVGPIIATALVAAVGNGEQFANGRQMSAAFGLTPRQHSSGSKERLLGISKRGDAYLRVATPMWRQLRWPTRPRAWLGLC